MKTPHSHFGGCLEPFVTFEKTGASLVLLLVVTHPTTVGRGGNVVEVTFELFWPVGNSCVFFGMIRMIKTLQIESVTLQ